MPTLAELAGDAFAAIADTLEDVAVTLGYRVTRPDSSDPSGVRKTSFSLRAHVTEGDYSLSVVGDAAAPTDTPTKTLRVLYADWPQATPPHVDDEIQFPEGAVYRVSSVERRLGGYYLITASPRKNAKW